MTDTERIAENEADQRLARYGRTIWETSRKDEGTISATGANVVAAAVIEVANDETNHLRRVVETLGQMVERRDMRLADLEAIVARVNALADEWDADWREDLNVVELHAELRRAIEGP